MTRRIVAFSIFVVVAAGVAVGVYFAGQVSDGTTAAQEGDGTTAAQEDAKNRAATAEAVIEQWLAEGTVPPALTITPYPTCPPDPPTPIPGEETTDWLATPAPWPCIPADQPPPDKTPDLSSLFQRPQEPEECEGCIDLGKPIPYEVPIKVGGKTIHLPVGSTSYIRINDYKVGTDPALRGPTEEEIIERGESKVVIDRHTGEIIEWNVVPEDEADFRRLILQALEPPVTVLPSSPTPPTPAPTLQPGVCPTPVRTTPADFAKPPPALPVATIPGWRLQGDATFRQGYLNLYLPAGREFIIATGSGERGNVSIRVYDVEAQSSLVIRGDGCEKERFIRTPAVDAVFDAIVAKLEVENTYVCAPASRSVLAPEEIPPDPAVLGQRVTGGSPEAAELGLHLPPDREFVIWQGIADPGGGFTGIYDIAARSFLFLGADGCEMSRRVGSPAADAMLDEIVRDFQAVRQ